MRRLLLPIFVFAVASISAAAADEVRIEMYGDSTTYGAQTVAGILRQTELNETRVLDEILSARFPTLDIVVNNNGVGGAQAVELLYGWDGVHAPWPAQMAESTADIVVLNFALNDASFNSNPVEGRMPVSPSQYGSVIESLVTVARTEGKIVVLEEPNPTMHALIGNAPIYSYVDTLRQVADRLDVPLIAQFDEIRKIPDWQSYLSEDRIHPSTALYAIKAKNSAAVLIPLIDAL